MARQLISAALFVLAAAVAGSALSQEPVKAIPGRDQTPGPGEYRIGPEDVLQISVWKNEAMSQTVPVRPDGKISLPLLNDLQAAGLTPIQLRDVLVKKLVEYIPAPEVSVIVREVHSFKVSVIGEVRRPGRYELRSRATVVDLLAQSEGFTEFASRARIVVLRPEGTTMKRIPFNYNKVISANGEAENFFLQAGDIVLVP
jgi:polysaccharide export outer membrane protein